MNQIGYAKICRIFINSSSVTHEGLQVTPYLNAGELAELLASQRAIETGVIHITHFKDTSDRTLTIGLSGATDEPENILYDHIYIEGKQLRRHAYQMEGPEVRTKIQTAAEGIPVLLLRPNLGAAPTATDLEFAKLMAKFHNPLYFFEMNSQKDKDLSTNNIEGKFLGRRQKYYFVNGHSQLY